MQKIIKGLLLTICFSFLVSSTNPVLAVYDPRTVPNNLSGLHILDPNEISSVPAFVNNQGGDWGYVTVPIQPSDHNKDKWQTFMASSLRLNLIPIIRITTIPLGGTWDFAKDTDLVDFANFLNELSWPIQNRYVILFNEVNRSSEWGGKVDPLTYTQIVKNARTLFKERNQDFFLLGPALDTALPTTSSSLSASSYLLAMEKADPEVWNYFDGWASHSYPNPGFTASPGKTGWQSLVSYRSELSSRNQKIDKPIFITETGWDQDKLSFTTLQSFWAKAFKTWENDIDVVAVTPFVLQGGTQYSTLSLTLPSGKPSNSAQILQSLAKKTGFPLLNNEPALTSSVGNSSDTSSNHPPFPYFHFHALLKIENLFRLLLGLPKKAYIRLGPANLTVELATTPIAWERGLSFRSSLAENQGMLFLFPRSHTPLFWMKNMLIPLDIIWLNNNKIVSLENNVPVSDNNSLPTYSPPEPVNMVLEVPAGYAETHQLTVGSKLTIYD